MRPRSENRWTLAGAALILVVFVAQGVLFLRANSQTSDEATHLAAGYAYVTQRDFRLNPEHPPLIKLLSGAAVRLAYSLPK